MSKKQKHLSMLLGGTLFSTCEIFGDIGFQVNDSSSEIVNAGAYEQASLLQQATKTTVREILNTLLLDKLLLDKLQQFSLKSDLEKGKFVDVFSAIILSAQEARSVLEVTTDSQTPTLSKAISDKIATSLTKILTSDKAEKIWTDSVSVGGPKQHRLYIISRHKLKIYAGLTLPSISLFVRNKAAAASQPTSQNASAANSAAKAAPVTHLEYADQDLTQYPDLVSLTITVAQLRAGADITSTKSLEIKVTGDAGSQLLNTERLKVPNAKIDLSAVINLTEVILPETVTTILKLPQTVTHLTANVEAFKSIGADSFNFPAQITHVTIVDSKTTSIGSDFFNNCAGLISVNLSGLTAVTTIEGGVLLALH